MTVTLPRPGEVGPGLPETPYVGLVPYGEGDAPFFFGRAQERKIVTANLRAARLTLLYGPSGVGKTSLLHAGVVANLRELAGPALAVAVFSSWSDDPLGALTEEIREAVSEALGEEIEAPAPETLLVETLGGWTQQVRRILVVLDQFEDYFLYHPDEDGEGTFFAEFPRLVNEPNLRVNFLLSIREDALAKLDRFEGRIPNLFGNYIRVDHLTRAGAREAVEGPIAEYNRRQAEGAEPYTIEPGLVDAVVEAAASGRLALAAAGNGALADEAASGKVETPFLQLVMERLWRATVAAGSHELSMRTLAELGGAQRIVENHLLEALGSLAPGEQAAAADLFRFLVSRSKTKIAHSASDLAEWTGRPEPEVAAVLDKLCRGEHGRLLRAVPPPAGEPEAMRYELYHDVLGEPIFEWRRRYEHKRDRRTMIRRFAVVGGVLLALVAAFAALGIWALVQRSDADRAASSASSLGLSQAANAQLAAHPNVALILGLEAVRARSTPQARRSMIAALEAAQRSGERKLLGHANAVYHVAFSPDGHMLASVGEDGTVRLWDPVYTYRQLAVIQGPFGASIDVAFSPDGRTIASAERNETIGLWDTRTHQQLAVLPDHSGPVLAVAFSPDGRTLASADGGGTLRFWDTRTHTQLAVLRFGPSKPGLGSTTNTLEFSPDGRTLAFAGADGAVRLLDARSHRQLAVLRGHRGPVGWLSFSPDGHLLASASVDGTARLWDARSHRQLAVLQGGSGWVAEVAFSPDAHMLATAGQDGTVRLWDTRSHRQLAIFHDQQPVNTVAFSPDGHTLASAGDDSVVRLRTVPRQPAVLHGHTGPVWAVAFSTDGHTLASGGDDTTVRLWNSNGHEPLAVLPGHGSRVGTVAFSPDGHTLASGSDDTTIRLWDTRGHRPPVVLQTEAAVNGVAFSPDGHTLASGGSGDPLVRLWDSRSHRQLAPFRGGSGAVAVAFSLDGHTLAAGGDAGTVRLWDTGSHRLLAVLQGHAGAVHGVAFSPVGHSLAVAYDDGAVRLWDTRSHRQLAVLSGHSGPVDSVAFSPDG